MFIVKALRSSEEMEQSTIPKVGIAGDERLLNAALSAMYGPSISAMASLQNQKPAPLH